MSSPVHRRSRPFAVRSGLVVLTVCTGLVASSRGPAGALVAVSDARAAPVVSVAAVPSAPPDRLDAAVARVDASGRAGTQIGVAVLDRATGHVVSGRLGATAFYSASVVKLLTAADLLRRAEIGKVVLTPAHRSLIRRSLNTSDDAAMHTLWRTFGGAGIVGEISTWAGLRDTRPPERAAEWAETKLSPRDVVAVYGFLMRTLNPTDQRLVVDALGTAPNRGADGFDQAFGLLATPRPAGAAAKQGWMIDRASEYLHSTGMLGTDHRYVLAVLTKRPARDGFPAARTDVTAAVSTLVGALTQTGGPASR